MTLIDLARRAEGRKMSLFRREKVVPFSFNSVTASALLLQLLLRVSTTGAYITYVVGGDLGWLIPSDGNINYTAWASNITFSLGNTLAFHYSTNSTVVQTDSLATYKSCNSNADDNSLQIWSSPGSTDSPVKLTQTGDTYFFSSAFDGEPCRSGQKFAIHVNFGQRLPPSLAPTSGSDEDDSGLPDFNGIAVPPPPPLGLNSLDNGSAGSSNAARLHHLWIMLILLARFLYS